MKHRPALILAAVLVAALVLTRRRPGPPPPPNPNSVPGPYAPLKPSALVLAPNVAVDPWRSGTTLPA